MQKNKIAIILLFVTIFFLISFFFFLIRNNDNDSYRESPEKEILWEGTVYQNSDLGYFFIYPEDWRIEEKEDLSLFHPSLENSNFLENNIDMKTYEKIFSVNIRGDSSLVYIDGVLQYDIEKDIYLNKNNLTARQWYDIAAIGKAQEEEKITKADFIRKTNSVIERGWIEDERGRVFNPWMPRGNNLKIGKQRIVKTKIPSNGFYEGYQYYILNFKNYILVFSFGYGGVTVPREMWQKNDNYIKDIIQTLGTL